MEKCVCFASCLVLSCSYFGLLYSCLCHSCLCHSCLCPLCSRFHVMCLYLCLSRFCLAPNFLYTLALVSLGSALLVRRFASILLRFCLGLCAFSSLPCASAQFQRGFHLLSLLWLVSSVLQLACVWLLSCSKLASSLRLFCSGPRLRCSCLASPLVCV